MVKLRRINISPIQQAASAMGRFAQRDTRDYVGEGLQRGVSTFVNKLEHERARKRQDKLQFMNDLQADVSDANMSLIGDQLEQWENNAVQMYKEHGERSNIPVDEWIEFKRGQRNIENVEKRLNATKQAFAEDLQFASQDGNIDHFDIDQDKLQEDLELIANGQAVPQRKDPYTGKRYVTPALIEDVDSYLAGFTPDYIDKFKTDAGKKLVGTVKIGDKEYPKYRYDLGGEQTAKAYINERMTPQFAKTIDTGMTESGKTNMSRSQFILEEHPDVLPRYIEEIGSQPVNYAPKSGRGKDEPKLVETTGEGLKWSFRDDPVRIAPGTMKYIGEGGKIQQEDVKTSYITGVEFDNELGQYIARVTIPTEKAKTELSEMESGQGGEDAAILNMMATWMSRGQGDMVKEVKVPFDYVKSEIERNKRLQGFDPGKISGSSDDDDFNLEQYETSY